MADNKIIIGTGKQDENKKPQHISKDKLYDSPIAPVEPEQEQEQKEEQEPEDERVWGNDFIIDKQLDKEYLDEKRRYVRVRYMQTIKCTAISQSTDEDPVTSGEPIELTMSDVSMGGIGAVCSRSIAVGSILGFDMNLDNIKYSIQCEVIYSILMEESYRIGLKILKKDKDFIRHLKILVARISLNAKYGSTKPE